MLKTFNRSDWIECPIQEKVREHMTRETSPHTLREHYPYRGYATQDIPTYGLKKGMVLQYVRVLHAPNYYPIEAIIGVQGEPVGYTGAPKRLRMQSGEFQVCE